MSNQDAVSVFSIGTVTPVLVAANAEALIRISCMNGGTVYYKNSSDVSSSVNDGSLTSGQSVVVSEPNWVVGSAMVWVKTTTYVPVFDSNHFPNPIIVTTNITDLAVTTGKLADSAVTSLKIANDSIVNADVNSAAAIAYSKLNLGTSIVNADVNASAAIDYSKLNLATSIVNADIGTSAAIAQSKITPVARGTSIPTVGLVDGQEYYYVADATNGVVWHLKYNSGSASTYKWEVVGGGCMYHEVLTAETSTSASYVDLATVGPTLTVPLAGDYEIRFDGRECFHNAAGDGCWVAVKIGAAATSDNDAARAQNPGLASAVNTVFSINGGFVRTVSAASTVVKLQYKAQTGATGSWAKRNLTIRPIRVI